MPELATGSAGNRVVITTTNSGQDAKLISQGYLSFSAQFWTAIFDGETVTYRRVEYDVERTVREIEAEPELDDFLGYRLREGR